MPRLRNSLIFALAATVLVDGLSVKGNRLLAQQINGFIVLSIDGADASDFDNAQYKIPFATILYQSDEGPNVFLGYFQGKLVTIERDAIVPVREAREVVAQAVSSDPSEKNWMLLAKIEQFLRNLEPARDAADKALQLNPHCVDAMFVIAEVNYRESDYDECVLNCDEALKLAPNRLDITARRAAALSNLDKTDEAIAEYKRVLELDPTMAPTWSNLGAAWERLGERHKAIDCFNKAVEFDPGFWHGWCCLAITESDVKKSLEFWDRCFQCAPNTYIPYYQATFRYLDIDDLAGYHRVMKLEVQFPDCPAYYKQEYAMRLATTTRDEFRDGQAALSILKELAESDGREKKDLSYQLTTCLAAAYAETGDFKKAMQLLDARPEIDHNPEGLRMYESFENGDPWRVDY